MKLNAVTTLKNTPRTPLKGGIVEGLAYKS